MRRRTMHSRWTVLFLLMVLVAAMMLCGCKTPCIVNTIRPWSPEDNQSNSALEILRMGSDFSSFAEFDVDKTYKTAKVGIEYYENGRLVEVSDKGTQEIYGHGGLGRHKDHINGVAGFSFQGGKGAFGIAPDGLCGGVSDIELRNYKKSDEDGLQWAGICSEQAITDGAKIYLGIVNSGGDGLNPGVFDNPGEDIPSARNLPKGKTWLFYIVFSSDESQTLEI